MNTIAVIQIDMELIKTNWISVEDRLPRLGKDVWIYWRNKKGKLEVEIGWNCSENDNYFQYWLGYDLETLWHKVLGWAPIQKPVPPKSEEE